MTSPSRHSALGIVAFITSLCGVAMFSIALGLGYLFVQRHAEVEGLALAPTLGVLGLISIGLNGLAGLLGVGSVLQHRRRRLFGVLALILSLAVLCVYLALGVWTHRQWQRSHPPAAPATHVPALPT
jgi:hypothetical protein